MTQKQYKEIKELLKQWREERGLTIEGQKKGFNANYTEELAEFFKAEQNNDTLGMIDALCDMCIIGMNADFGYDEKLFLNIKKLGYDPYLCVKETIKEISSRTGAWNEKKGKWIKDTSEEAKSKWYKADYEKCKLE